MNLLANALNTIQTLTPSEPITLIISSIENRKGFQHTTKQEITNIYAHIQPITPAELKKYTDNTIDSNMCYKFYFIGKHAQVLNSIANLNATEIKWRNKTLKTYGVKDWYLQNGWVAIYATISQTQTNTEAQND